MIRKRFVINFNNRKYRFLPGPRAGRLTLLVTLLPSAPLPFIASFLLLPPALHNSVALPFFYSFHVVRLR